MILLFIQYMIDETAEHVLTVKLKPSYMYYLRSLRWKKRNPLSTSFFDTLSKHQTLNLGTSTRQHVSSHTHQSEFNESNVIASNKLITSYVRCGDVDSAFGVFENMKVKSTVTWNSILAAFAKKHGHFEQARQLFEKIPQPNAVSYNIMLACHLHHFGVHEARGFFDSMPMKDIASWNTMISGYAQVGLMGEARRLFSAMPLKNCVSWSAMVSGYVACGDLDSAVECFYAAPVRSVITWTAMITGYMKFGRVESAERLFQEMSMRTLVTWNAMIAGYVENGRAEDGLRLFRTMLEKTGLKPNALSLTSVLLGCSNLSALQLGKQVHQLVCKSPLSSDTTAGTSLVSMYSKCGDLKDAWELFIQIPRKDVVCWNAMISGYAQHGDGEKALHLFDEMKNEGIKPDWITFVAVLLACNHAGMVDLGVQYFNTLRDFGIVIKPEHYACMVDLLGRAGKLSEAVDLIKSMPFKPHPAIYGTLLGACRIHKNLNLAEFAAKNLLELDPTSATGYVQLANVYAAQNRWDHVARIRRSMKENNVVKIPGYSWIEINNVVHEFRSSDRLHPELASIHAKLNDLEKKMKLAGYVPDLEFALHDVGEELKEQLLLWHSEKLAIAFGLLKVPLGVPIRVFKNLRVCGDCHSAIKYISAIEGREIIVRDTTRFHHFKNGFCSCRDYW